MAQWHYGPEGEVISRRRKLKPTHVERSVFGEGDGSDMIVTQTDFGRVGALCCWEHLQPLSKYALFSQDEQIHCAAWPAFSLYAKLSKAFSPEVSVNVNQIYAVEGQCFVLSSCSGGSASPTGVRRASKTARSACRSAAKPGSGG